MCCFSSYLRVDWLFSLTAEDEVVELTCAR